MTIVTAMALRGPACGRAGGGADAHVAATGPDRQLPVQREFANGYLLTEESRVFYQDDYRPVVTVCAGVARCRATSPTLPPAVRAHGPASDPLRERAAPTPPLIPPACRPRTSRRSANIHALGLLRKAIPSAVAESPRR